MTQTSLRQEKLETLPGRAVLVGINSRYIHSSPALFYLRNCLVQNGICSDPRLYQATINDNYYETLLRITGDAPGLICFSANIWNSERIEALVKDVQQVLPESLIVVGGPQARVLREQLPDEVCSVVIGEIEAVDGRFYTDLKSRKMEPEYRASFLGRRMDRLDYPFRDEDFSDHLKDRYIYYETSRGCPHSCSYCQSAEEKGLFHKGLEQVERELDHILSFRPRIIRFVDRTFNDLPERTLAIWKYLASRPEETLYHFEIAPDRFTEEMFGFLEGIPSGKFQFEIGIQSTNGDTLKAISRRMDTARVHGIISRLAELGTIHLHVDLILGLPFETQTSFARSFRDVFDMGAHYIQMGLLKILPGTPLMEQVEEFGYQYCGKPPYSVFANRWLDHSTLSAMYWFCECVEKFHNNRYFVSLWAYLRRRGEDIYLFFSGLTDMGHSKQLFERSPTQQFLTEVLVDYCRKRDDFELVVELLRFDWLRCGFRKLPACLDFPAGDEDCVATRDGLYRQLPESVPGVFNNRERNVFFKRSVFLRLSATACNILGLESGGARGRIALSGEREENLFGHNRVITFR